MTQLSTLELSPQAAAVNYSVIWLHGLGADGHDFEPIVPELKIMEEYGVRFVFPHAPHIPITINAGYVMPGWYDILSLEFVDREDKAGVLQSIEYISQLIEREHTEQNIPYENIILAGFSQGGAIALSTGLTTHKPIKAIIALSTYIPIREYLSTKLNPERLNTPIFMAHGTMDPVVPFGIGQQSKKWLEQNNIDVDWHSYPMQHNVCMEEINDLSQWLKNLL